MERVINVYVHLWNSVQNWACIIFNKQITIPGMGLLISKHILSTPYDGSKPFMYHTTFAYRINFVFLQVGLATLWLVV
jgi:hypothetical protein